MAFEWATSGPYEGYTVTLVEEDRGWQIWYLTGPGGLYGFVNPEGVELSTFRSSLPEARDYIYSIIGPPPEEPPEPEPEPPVEPDPKQPFMEYRGCTIFVWPLYDPYHYNSSCTVTHRLSLERVKEDIDALLGPEPEPIPDPTEKTLIGPYRGIDIFKFVATGWFTFTYETVEYTIQYWNPTIAKIDELLGALPVPDEPVTTWAGYQIWKRSIDGMYYVMVDGVPQGEFYSIIEAQIYIEDVLGAFPGGDPYTPGADPDYTPMDKDPVRAAAITGPVRDFLTSVGLTPEALDAVVGSGADPEKAAAYAKSVSMASVGAIAILGTIGVVAEVASLGQVEGVLGTIDMVLEKTGIAGVLEELFKIPFMSALVTPAHHYWNSVYTPEISGLSQLTRELVREVITLDTYMAEAAMQGLSAERAMRIWDSHWRELGIRDTDIILHRGGMSEEEWEKYRVIQDYRPDPRPGFEFSDLDMSKVLRKTILGRVDTRRAYQYGYMDRPKLIEMYTFQGYEEDAELQADIQIRASVDGLQSAIRREEGMMYRDRLKDARKDESTAVGIILADRNTKLVDLGNATIAGEYTEEEAAIIEADIRKDADVAIATVRPKARAREEEAEVLYRTALEEVKDLIDPEDLWVMRYKLAAARVEVAEEFEIVPPVEVVETPEEPE